MEHIGIEKIGEMAREIWPGKTLHVSSETDPTVLIGLGAEINGKMIGWHDTVKERMMEIGKILKDDAEEFVFESVDDEGGRIGIYKLEPMTLDIFRKEVKDKLLQAVDFGSEDEMFEFFSNAGD